MTECITVSAPTRMAFLELFKLCKMDLENAPIEVMRGLTCAEMPIEIARGTVRMVSLCLRHELNARKLDIDGDVHRRRILAEARTGLAELQGKARCFGSSGKILGPPPRHLCFGWAVDDSQHAVFLWDHDVGLSVTNAAEQICDWALGVAPAGYRIVYRDTMGMWGQLSRRRSDGAFVGYSPHMPNGVALDEPLLREHIAPAD